MANEKLTKSLKLVHTILKIERVLLIIGIVLCCLVTFAWSGIATLLEYAFHSGELGSAELAEINALFGTVSAEDITSLGYMMFIPAIISSVFAFMYTTKGVKLLERMRTGGIFRREYGEDIRGIAKLMIISMAVSFVAAFVLMLIMAPQAGTSSLSFNLNGLVMAAFLYMASYLMDAAYENKIKADSAEYNDTAVYSQPMIGDGSEE